MIPKKVRKLPTPKVFNPKRYIAVDTETTGIDVYGKSQAFMVSMADENGNTQVFQWPVDPFTRNVTPKPIDVAIIKSYVENDRLEKVFHNSKFDVAMLAKSGIKVKGIIHDTLFMARVCFTLEMNYGLKYLALTRLGIPTNDEKDLQIAVNSARRKLKSYNLKVEEEENERKQELKTNPQGYGMIPRSFRKMISAAEPEEDYWLPTYFEPDNIICQRYAKLDAFRTMSLFRFYDNLMNEDSYLRNTYNKEMQEIWPIVNSMERRGIKVFPEAVDTEAKLCEEAAKKHLTVMMQMVKEFKLQPFPPEKMEAKPGSSAKVKANFTQPRFNPSSAQQLARVLYLPEGQGGLGLVTDRRNRKTGNVTTDKDTLRELMYSPFVQQLVEYRAAEHTLSLFFKKFNVLMKPDKFGVGNFCLHPGFNQCGTKTGRFSCANPNLQQVSAGGKKSLAASYNGAKVFGPRKGYIWLGFDYSQQEGRIFAYLAQVPVMLHALESGTDLFEAMSNKAWGGKGNPNATKAVIKALELTSTTLPENEAIKEVWDKYSWTSGVGNIVRNAEFISDAWLSEFDYDIVAAENSLGKTACRQRCKHITYAKIFGGGPGSYTHLLYCSLAEAKVFDVEYNASMPEMKRFMKETEAQAKRDGYIINLYDRKLRVDKNFAYRGVSYMIQGSAADQMKSALIRVNKFLRSSKLNAHIVMTIHDSMYIEVATKDYSLALVRAIKNRMEDTEGRIGVAMPVGAEIIRGKWGESEEKLYV